MLNKICETELFKLLKFMKKRTRLYIFTMVLRNLITAACFNVVIAFITKDVFDAVQNGKSFFILRATFLAAGSFIIGSTINPVASYIMNKCIKETMKEIRTSAFKKIEELPMESFEKTHSGEFISIVTNDLNNMEAIYSTEMNSLVFGIILGILAMASIFLLEWHIALVVLILGIITILINNFFAVKIRKFSDEVQSQYGKITEKIIDLIHSSNTTKMYNIEKKVYGLFSKENIKHFTYLMKLTKAEANYDAINIILANLKDVGILCLSLFMLFKGYIMVGTVLAVMQLMGNANYMYENIGNFIKDMQKSLAGASRVLKLLSMDSEKDNCYYEMNLNENSNNNDSMVELRNISFGYNDNLILKNLNLNVKVGKVTAIIGHSGCGKSTLAKLLLDFYNPTAGNIIINGKNILDYSLMNIREKIAYVPQNPYLFQGTIEENIGYGKLGASKAEIISAAKAANAHEFIMGLPCGYDALVGEGGENLSGGQKQRIAIARALLKDAPILLLDEATSALDSESEKEIQKELESLMKNKTTIIIAHRLSTIKNADEIFVLDKGKVAEHGSHDELLIQNGLYKTMLQG